MQDPNVEPSVKKKIQKDVVKEVKTSVEPKARTWIEKKKSNAPHKPRQQGVTTCHFAPIQAAQSAAEAATARSPRSSPWKTMDYALNDMLVQKVLDHFKMGTPSVDCFAAAHNARFPRYWSEEDSAWERSWGLHRQGLLWMNPPFDKFEEVMSKIRKDKALAIVIVPGWQKTAWWTLMEEMAVDKLCLGRGHGTFLREGKFKMPPPRWAVWAVLVDGNLPSLESVNMLMAEKAGIDNWDMQVTPGVEIKEGDRLTPEEVDRIGEQLLA